MSGMPSGEKGGKSGNAESRAGAHSLPRDRAPGAFGPTLPEHENVIGDGDVTQQK